MTYRITILSIFLSFSLHCFPQKFLTIQTWNVDSLKIILPEQEGEEKVNTLNRLAVSLFFVDTMLSRDYADAAMELSREIGYLEGKAGACRNYGYIEQYRGNYPEALKHYFEALAIYDQIGQKHTAAWLYYDIAKTHFYARNYEKTVEYGNRAMERFRERLPGGETVGNVHDTIATRGGIGLALSEQGLIREVIEFYRENERVMKEEAFSAVDVQITTWLIGLHLYTLGEIDSAVAHFHRALSFKEDNVNITAQKYRAMIWLGDLYYSRGMTDSAMYYHQKALKWYDEKGFLIWALYASNYLGNNYYYLNDLKKAEVNFLVSERLFDEMLARNSWVRHDSLKYIAAYGHELYSPIPLSEMEFMRWAWGKWAYYGLFLVYQKRNNTTEALKYHILSADAGDSLNKIRQERETVEIQTRYESEQKEKQIEYLSEENAFKSFRLRQSRIILFGLAGFIILIILLAIAVIRQGRLREKQNSLILQQKLFRSQMNPHFIFNSLSSIHHFMINEKPAKAASYLSKFSKLIRNILHGSMDEYTSLGNEIGIIENYLELQKLRFPGKFDFNIGLDAQLDPEHISIPSMITQPFVENAVEHGIKHKETKGNISVRISQNDGMILIEVEDDGIGRAKAKEISLQQNKDHQSLATSIIRERIRILNRTLKKKISLKITDLVKERDEAAGTKVQLEVPLL